MQQRPGNALACGRTGFGLTNILLCLSVPIPLSLSPSVYMSLLLSQRFSAPVQLPRLRQGLGDQERLSESLISELLDESINPDEFIRSFKQVRTLAYRRSVMVDKWIGGQVNWDD